MLAAQAATSEQPEIDSGGKGAPGRWLSLTCKATDESFNTQPESPASIWNLRGILNNSWHTIHVKLPKCNHPDCTGVNCTRMPLGRTGIDSRVAVPRKVQSGASCCHPARRFVDSAWCRRRGHSHRILQSGDLVH